MLSKTLLDTLKAVTGEVGLPQPQVVVSSQVLTDVQLKQLALAAGEELLDAHDWQSLTKRYTVTITSATLYDLPSDFYRLINQTVWIGTEPLDTATTMSWTRLESGEKRFRVIGDQLEVYQPETMLGQTLSFYYISKNFIVDGGGGLAKSEFTLDSDKTVFHPRLFTNFVKLKLLQTKDMDTRAVAEDFNASLETAIGSDTPAPALWIEGDGRLVPSLPWDLE